MNIIYDFIKLQSKPGREREEGRENCMLLENSYVIAGTKFGPAREHTDILVVCSVKEYRGIAAAAGLSNLLRRGNLFLITD